MNNYLRWLVAVLFATVCNLGYAQSNEPEVTLDFTLASNPWQLKEGSYEMNKKAYTYDGYTIEIEGSHYLNKSESTYFLQCKDGTYVTLPKLNFAVSRIVLEIHTPAKALKNSVCIGNKVVVTTAAGAATCDLAIPESNQSAGTIYRIYNAGAVSRIKQIKIYSKAGSAKTPTSLSFDGLMGEGIMLTDGKTASGEAFTGYQAVETNSVPGKVSYETSGDRVAEVDASTGAVVVHANVYGTMTITAKFQPDDKEKYASSTAQYTITNKRVGTYAFHESFDQCDGKEGWYGFAAKGEWDASKMDNVWKHTGTVYLGSGCIRIGPDHGSVTTPVIRVDGSAVLTFKAAMWKTQNEQTDVVVTISDGSLTYGDKAPAKKVSVTPIKAQWTDYEMVITGTGEFTLTFANVTNSKNKENNRFFLDEVTVTESAAREITLNEEKANVIETEGKANVTLRRTLYDDGWNTLCLPFSLSEAQAKLAFGDGVELRELEKVEGTTLIFKAVKGLTAGVPCLIRPSRVAEDNTYTFSGVQTMVVTADSRAKDAVGGAISFTGIYSPVDVTGWADSHNEYVAFLGAGNKFFRALSGKPMKAFRAFFIVPETTSVAAVKAVIDGTTTAIGELNVDGDKTGGRVYNLNGQCVGTSLDGLQPGIYIRHGKKIVVK